MRLPLAPVVLVLVSELALVPAPGSAADPISAALDRQMAKLTAALGDEAFADREAAEGKLRAFGMLALPRLVKAVKDPNPEVRERAARLVRELRPKAMPLVHELKTDPRINYRDLKFSRDGKLVAAVGEFAVHVWEVETGRSVRRVVVKDYTHYSLEFAADGKALWTGGNGAINRIDVATGETTRFVKEYRSLFDNLLLTPDGKYLLASGLDRLHVFDPATGKKVHAVKVTPFRINQIRLSPDGTAVAAGCTGLTVAIIDHVNGKLVREWKIPADRPLDEADASQEQVFCVAWAPDGKSLACGMISDELAGQIQIRTPKGKLIQEWRAHTRRVYQLAFVNRGRLLMSLGDDYREGGSTIFAVWNCDSGKAVVRSRPHEVTGFRLAAMESAGMFAVFGWTGRVRLQHLPQPAWAGAPFLAD